MQAIVVNRTPYELVVDLTDLHKGEWIKEPVNIGPNASQTGFALEYRTNDPYDNGRASCTVNYIVNNTVEGPDGQVTVENKGLIQVRFDGLYPAMDALVGSFGLETSGRGGIFHYVVSMG